ncbi:hypothetical protein CRG98_002721 [Punica granatum]|uniref:Uncharacterized protein n=1 Tax=Punica granatum TaxID=22663 RepID=A0A2I0L8A8_PUNGR|nr:hypothetical protein CRG98_002721 [Punica granatum]
MPSGVVVCGEALTEFGPSSFPPLLSNSEGARGQTRLEAPTRRGHLVRGGGGESPAWTVARGLPYRPPSPSGVVPRVRRATVGWGAPNNLPLYIQLKIKEKNYF